jgi:hypothetical protein
MVEDVSVRSIEQARQAYEHGTLRERLARFHQDVDGAFWQWNDVWLSPAFRAFDIRAECRAITAPLLAIQGLDDEYGTLAQVHELQRAVPHARLLELPACGHSPQRDQPGRSTRRSSIFCRAPDTAMHGHSSRFSFSVDAADARAGRTSPAAPPAPPGPMPARSAPAQVRRR